MTSISWLDEQILALDRIVDRVANPGVYCKVPDRFSGECHPPWICQAISNQTHPWRVTDGQNDLGHYATLENAQRALAEMTA